MFTESEHELINRIHHALMRQLFVYEQLQKQERGSDIYKLIRNESINYQMYTLEPLMKQWGLLSMKYHKSTNWDRATVHGRTTGKYILYTSSHDRNKKRR